MRNFKISLSWDPSTADAPDALVRREWIVTNGIGGYASGTLSGIPTRRYHGLLIASLAAPHGRQVFLNHLSELIVFPDGTSANLSPDLAPPDVSPEGNKTRQFRLSEFRLEEGQPVWRFDLDEYAIERRILAVHGQNTVHVSYGLVRGEAELELHLQPAVFFRPHEDEPEIRDLAKRYTLSQRDNRYEIEADDSRLPPLRMLLHAPEHSFFHHPEQVTLTYREEKNRGYACDGSLWTPGYFQTKFNSSASVTLTASTQNWEHINALPPDVASDAEGIRRMHLLTTAAPELRVDAIRQCIVAADQFVISPVGRLADSARSQAMGEMPRSIIAGYHWFTDWGRDTMISLEGLTLSTGRFNDARWILHTFSLHVQNGLIPNLFPEGEREGLYHTADATLWFFHAVARFTECTGDRELLGILLPKLIDIVEWHCRGTDFGIGMDEKDGLLRQGAANYQLTWMDAKVGDWVVTPRRGKAVEINALWFNALCLLAEWLREENREGEAEKYSSLAARAKESFNRRFWNEQSGYLFDVVDGEDGKDDPACRPNQIFAVSLPNPVLDEPRWKAIVDTVEGRLLTPFGLRSLSRDHPDYKATYTGDRRARDAAYHQGTVWAWLIGPFIDAWLRVHPGDNKKARSFLSGLIVHLSDAGLGTISEVFDAEAPFTPRGCIAQAWSVAEVIRSWRNTYEAEKSAEAHGVSPY